MNSPIHLKTCTWQKYTLHSSLKYEQITNLKVGNTLIKVTGDYREQLFSKFTLVQWSVLELSPVLKCFE